jgi:hypothetical protein
MHQQISGVHKIVRRRLNGILSDVTTTDLDVLCIDIAKKPHIEVGGHDCSSGSNPLRKPTRHRPRASADLKTSPALSNTNCIELSKRRRIVELLDQLSTVA